jgi:ubiquinone/menaquinone biosynthesis C-methylase UbiE
MSERAETEAIRPADTPEAAAELKACCAAAYSSDAVALILGDSYHPGGLDLTRRLARALGLRPGQRVLDVASGPGATALMLAAEFGVTVDGVDLAETNVATAQQGADQAGLADRVRFHVGDAERLPFDGGAFDAVVCECALCTFPDKPAAAAEFARALAPGGRAGITDVTLAPGGLPDELAGLAGWVACLADARPADEYQTILADAGLRPILAEAHNAALARMIEQIHARLSAFRLLAGPRDALPGIDVDGALQLTAQASRAVQAGAAGYALLVAHKP